MSLLSKAPRWFIETPAGRQVVKDAEASQQKRDLTRRRELLQQKFELEKARDETVGGLLEKLSAAKGVYAVSCDAMEAAHTKLVEANTHTQGTAHQFSHRLQLIDRELGQLSRGPVDEFVASLKVELERLGRIEVGRETKPRYELGGRQVGETVVASEWPAIKACVLSCLDARSKAELLLLSCSSQEQLETRLAELRDGLPAIQMVKVVA